MTPTQSGQDSESYQIHNPYDYQNPNIPDATRLTIKIPNMTSGGYSGPLRRSSRLHTGSDDAGPSGSEYQQSERSAMDEDELGKPEDGEEEEEKPVLTKTRRGRTVLKVTYVESENDEDAEGEPDGPADDLLDFHDDPKPRPTRGRRTAEPADDEDSEPLPRRSTRRRNTMDGFIVDDDENQGYATRLRKRNPPPPKANGRPASSRQNTAESREARARRRQQKKEEADGGVYVDEPSSPNSADADGSFDDEDNPPASDDMDLEMDPDPEPEEEEPGPETDGKPYALRQRAKINYAIPPPLEDMPRPPPPKPSKGGAGGRSGWHGRRTKGPGWSASGAELGKWMGLPADDSDSDVPTRTPRKPFGLGAFDGAVAGGGGGLLPGDLAAAGTPSNLGKVGDSTLADADPLGINVNVTFDEVGGLDEHINSLKEMTVLPLLYPEVFQQFKVTPPRGVLFHGPPGTGKTLLARALAASCRSNGRRITFFMRKGADALSKWVGEAERQLRLLFEEARASQPSIIFFDEIDGLAPVRSSKQDQIHASIVSTLLALMDGMDGRGQVVVIGATNRPDAIDPALRRPGRFDREFYFPLPGLEAREKILKIMTKEWRGWHDEKSNERIKGLAKLTKGYGGADLRALCTEAALNAVQRKYPQIYKSNDRLLLQPDSIAVGLRDFMISIKKLVPSSARSSASAAAPLPPQFAPLLSDTVEKVKTVISRVLPVEKKLTALEEAEYEDYDGEEDALEREMTLQSMETLRIYRPRLVLHGPVGMGQSYVGAALLHHLEGYHVQSLELGTLMGDSTRTVEAAIVQLFVEAKRHQPSVIYIPSLVGWCAAISETARSTVRAMLDTLAPTDPILLLAIVDGKFTDLPRDVRGWFGPAKDNRVALPVPTAFQREEFFKGLIEDIRRPPNQFADGMKRKKRILEELPIAPPLEPRQPTAAELAVQVESDHRTIALLKYRLGPILTELKRKFKRFTKRATDEYDFSEPPPPPAPMAQAVTAMIQIAADGSTEVVSEAQQVPLVNGVVNGIEHAPDSVPQAVPEPAPQVEEIPQLYDMDLERMHIELYKGRYLTPQDFMDDVNKIVHNAAIRAREDLDRHYKAQAMLTATEVSMHDFDPTLRMECERMAVRERKRREEYKKNKEEKEKAKSASVDPPQVNGTRRSARNNGLQPELTLTDPVKLERKLKRQREGGGASTDSNGSEEEGVEGRDTKRSRILLGVTESEGDPLNITTPLHTPPRAAGVRFASIEPARSPWPAAGSVQPPPPPPNGMGMPQAGVEGPVPAMMPSQSPFPDPTMSTQPPGQEPFQMSLPPISQLPIHFSNPNYPQPPFHTHAPPPLQPPEAMGMVVDPPPPTNPPARSTGFDALLNPMTPDTEQPVAGPSSFPSFTAATVPPQDDNPFLVAPIPQQARQRSYSPHAPIPILHRRTKSPDPETANPPSPSPMPIVIERTPTPLPDFHVDDELVHSLKLSLREKTSSLTIEQLEQLRATCLGCVWRHRTEWDRDAAVREVQGIVREFVEEAKDDDSEMDDGPDS